jgi:hypothetical protein
MDDLSPHASLACMFVCLSKVCLCFQWTAENLISRYQICEHLHTYIYTYIHIYIHTYVKLITEKPKKIFIKTAIEIIKKNPEL